MTYCTFTNLSNSAIPYFDLFFCLFSCQSNCRLRINPLARLVVMGRCTECGLYLSYNWTLFSGSDSTEITLNWLKDTLTPRDASSFVLIKGVLERSKRYTAKLSITSIWGKFGISERSLISSLTLGFKAVWFYFSIMIRFMGPIETY